MSNKPEAVDTFEDLTTGEQAFVAAFFTEMWGHPDHRETLPLLMKGWRRFVGQLTEPYRMSIYDYTHFIGFREVLEQLLVKSAEPLHARLGEALAPLDERFRSLTEPVGRSTLGDNREQWWWYRIPVLVGERLRRDLVEQGYLSDTPS